MDLYATLLGGESRRPIVLSCSEIEEGFFLGKNHPCNPSCIEITPKNAGGGAQASIAKFRRFEVGGEQIWKMVRD